MKNTRRLAFASLLAVLFVSAPHAHAALLASQEDSSGTPVHYWHSDGTNGAYLVLDPNDGQPGFSIGILATTDTQVLGIHIKAQFDTDGALGSLPKLPYLYDETGAHAYACARESFTGFAYGTPADALARQNPIGPDNQMTDMYFNCAVGSGHETVYANTSYRLYFYPVSATDVNDIYVAANASSTPYYEVSVDGGYPPPPLPIAISAPQQGTTYFSTDTIIPQATIANLASYSSITYLLNGTAVDPTQPLPISTLPAGPATLVIAATDSSGNITYATSTFMIADTQPPTIVINQPINGHSYLQNDVASIDATITDNVAVATSTYTLNGALVNPTQTLPFMSLPLGTNTLVVSATDTSGNIAYATSTFTLLPPDLTPPTITVTSPTAGATYTNTSNVFLSATVTDASPIAATSYTFNGVTIDPTQPLPLLGAPLGPASVSVAATDAYGNAASTTVNFFIRSADVTPPTITITNPIAGHSYVSTTTVYAVAAIADASGIATSSYTLNGIVINPAQPLPLTLAGAGTAKLVVSATDTYGNTASSSVTFTITVPPPPDRTPPAITITSPIAGHLYTRNDTVYLTATITDQSPIAAKRYYFDGQLIDSTKPLAFKKAPLGTNTVSVVATDSFGNTGSSTLTFRIVPGDDTCIADIIDALNHKWISGKQAFNNAFDDCNKITSREGDRNGYDNDDTAHHKDPSSDNRCLQAVQDINNAFADIDRNISN